MSECQNNYIQITGPLFKEVQEQNIFSDCKRFVDCVPIGDPKNIIKKFEESKNSLECDLDKIVTGGEYSIQEGFGWTNGVFLALSISS